MGKKTMIFGIILLLLGLILIVISIVIGFDLVPSFVSFRNALTGVIGSIGGIIVIIYGVWKAVPDDLKNIAAKLLRKAPDLPNYFKKKTIALEIESEINKSLKEFGKEGAGFVQTEVEVKWLTADENARKLFFEGNKAYIKLDFRDDKETNIVEAVLLYSNNCLLVEARQYASKPLMRAIDLTFTDEILVRRNITRARTYFNQDVVPREVKSDPSVGKYLDILDLLSQHGLFIRIFLPEINDYPGRTARIASRKTHMEQIDAFIYYLKTAAEERTALFKRAWIHVSETIRVGIILVGIPVKLQFEGTRPYVRRIAMDNRLGARVVYLIGYNFGTTYVPEIAKEAKARGIVNNYTIDEYDALIGGEVKKQVIARLLIGDGAGKRFLDLYGSQNGWPSLEDEKEANIIDKTNLESNHIQNQIIGEHEDMKPLKAIPNKELLKESKPQITSKSNQPEEWERNLDNAWRSRIKSGYLKISGSMASEDALKILGVTQLKKSPYKTLNGIVNASSLLKSRWKIEDNYVMPLGK